MTQYQIHSMQIEKNGKIIEGFTWEGAVRNLNTTALKRDQNDAVKSLFEDGLCLRLFQKVLGLVQTSHFTNDVPNLMQLCENSRFYS